MSHTFPFLKPPLAASLPARGFTLVELLVVIGIIALLISILLPSLNQARRAANQVKCLAALREIGNAFHLYGNDWNDHWPMARWFPPGAGEDERREWTDYLAPYISTVQIESVRSISEIRERSILWGCPEWRRAFEYNTASLAQIIYTGYGMQYYPTYFEDGLLTNLAIRTDAVDGKFVKGSVWKRRGAERGLVADAIVGPVNVPPTFSIGATLWAPYVTSGWGPFWADSTRHAKPGLSKTESARVRGVNILYCDGHAEAGSVVDAWNSFRNPGQDTSTP